MPDHRVVIVRCGHHKGQISKGPDYDWELFTCQEIINNGWCPDPTCPGNDMEGG